MCLPPMLQTGEVAQPKGAAMQGGVLGEESVNSPWVPWRAASRLGLLSRAPTTSLMHSHCPNSKLDCVMAMQRLACSQF